MLRQWDALQGEWERKLNVVAVTPVRANEIAARWAGWTAADPNRLDRDGETAGRCTSHTAR